MIKKLFSQPLNPGFSNHDIAAARAFMAKLIRKNRSGSVFRHV
jgi:transposase-like protein